MKKILFLFCLLWVGYSAIGQDFAVDSTSKKQPDYSCLIHSDSIPLEKLRVSGLFSSGSKGYVIRNKTDFQNLKLSNPCFVIPDVNFDTHSLIGYVGNSFNGFQIVHDMKCDRDEYVVVATISVQTFSLTQPFSLRLYGH